MKFIFLILILLVPMVYYSLVYTEQTVIIQPISGHYHYSFDHNIIQILTIGDGYGCGDGWDSFDTYFYAAHSFQSFNILTPLDGYHIRTITVNYYIMLMIGNDTLNTYPIFNTPNLTYQPACILDHVNYGNNIDVNDYNTPNLHSPEILLDSYTIGWVSHDITNWVLDDINNNRQYTQLRMRLQNSSDWDNYCDGISTYGFTHHQGIYAPYLEYTFESDSTALVDESLVSTVSEIRNYPNPFRENTIIRFTLSEKGKIDLSIYNTKGQIVRTLVDSIKDDGLNQVNWDGKDATGKKVSSGVYFYRITTLGRTYSGKALFIK